MNSKQRAQLKGLANTLEPIFQVGKGGINEQLIRQVDETLEKRELIKLAVLETAPLAVAQAAQEIATATKSEVVQVIGRKFILYRQSVENKKIILRK